MDQQIKDPNVLNVLVLERVDRTKNMARYYVLSVEPTLFAKSSLVRRWGRIGGFGRTRIDLHASPPLAQIALNTWLERKRRRRSTNSAPDCRRTGDGDNNGRNVLAIVASQH